MKRILVDMSATLIHHGHIRLLREAKKMGYVVVGLTSDEEIKKKKGYAPELNYDSRKEILESIKYVDEVIVAPWLIDEEYLDHYNIDLLVHGSDNANQISEKRTAIFPRTQGISSSILRGRVLNAVAESYLSKI